MRNRTFFLFTASITYLVAAIGWLSVQAQTPANPMIQLLPERWQFKFLSEPDENLENTFYKPTFDDSAWGSIPVPANWEMLGYEEPHYFYPDTKPRGLYRVSFRMPAQWQDQYTHLRLEGVSFGYTLWINGHQLGSWHSAFQPAQFLIEPFIKKR
ncbi:MAG: hypothetical protein HC880_21820 [Bacteroidia bacterium]|nr:hypothetical protein [Bacteroidia bacterium]